MCVDTNPMISAASRGESAPAAQEAMTADDALSASATLSIFGRSNATGRSRRGGKMRSRQSRSAVVSPSSAFSINLRERLIPLTPGLRNMVTCGAPWHKNK